MTEEAKTVAGEPVGQAPPCYPMLPDEIQQYGLYARKAIRMMVQIPFGKDLRPVTKKNHCTYVQLQFGNRTEQVQGTDSVSDIANPRWNTNTFEFATPLNDFFMDPILHVHVYHNNGTHQEFQGRTCIDVRQLMSVTGKTVEQDFRLEDSEKRAGTKNEIKEWGCIHMKLSLSEPEQTNFLLYINGGVIFDHYNRCVFQVAHIPQPVRTRILYAAQASSPGTQSIEIARSIVSGNTVTIYDGKGSILCQATQTGSFSMTVQPAGKNYAVSYEGGLKLINNVNGVLETVATFEKSAQLPGAADRVTVKVKPSEDVALVLCLLYGLNDLLPSYRDLLRV